MSSMQRGSMPRNISLPSPRHCEYRVRWRGATWGESTSEKTKVFATKDAALRFLHSLLSRSPESSRLSPPAYVFIEYRRVDAWRALQGEGGGR